MANACTNGPARRPAGESSVLLFLGLYLLILAFFILLVSLSTIEERKARAAMDSLSATFAGRARPAGVSGGTSEGNEPLPTEREIVGAFAALVRVVEVDILKPGRLMRVGLPLAVVFATGESAPRTSLYPVLDRVVAALSSPPPGVRIDAEFSLDRGTTLEERVFAAARADALVRATIARGAPPARLSISLAHNAAHDGADRMWMTFRIAEPGGLAGRAGDRF